MILAMMCVLVRYIDRFIKSYTLGEGVRQAKLCMRIIFIIRGLYEIYDGFRDVGAFTWWVVLANPLSGFYV